MTIQEVLQDQGGLWLKARNAIASAIAPWTPVMSLKERNDCATRVLAELADAEIYIATEDELK